MQHLEKRLLLIKATLNAENTHTHKRKERKKKKKVYRNSLGSQRFCDDNLALDPNFQSCGVPSSAGTAAHLALGGVTGEREVILNTGK